MSAPDIAVVLTAHAEGRVLVPTIRSLERAVLRAADTGFVVEIVLVMDRTDGETRRVLRAHLLDRSALKDRVTAMEVDNGDLGASRNDGIARSTARYVAIADGDNLITSNWLVDGVAALRAHDGPAVAHVDLIVSFGERRTLWPQLPSTDPGFDAGIFAVANYWDSSAIARRELFEQYPYPVLPAADGFGPEDWVWNMSTLQAGVDHITIAQSAMFYRARAGSLMAERGASLLPPTAFLADLRRAQTYARPSHDYSEGLVGRTREVARQVLPFGVRRVAVVAARAARSVLRPWVHGGRRVVGRLRPVALEACPEWLADEWRVANEIEPAVPFLRADTFAQYEPWGPPWSDFETERAAAYWRILAELRGHVDYLFIAPWLKTGGGDRVLLQYIDAVRRLDPSARIGLLTTEGDESTRLADAPPGVAVVELRDHYSIAVDREWVVDRLLPQLLTQIAPRTIHVFNSTVGFDVLERFARLLSRTTSLFLSSFVMDRTPDGERTSVMFYRHPQFLTPIRAVLVDSRAFIDTMVAENGYPVDKFVLQRQIVPELAEIAPQASDGALDRPVRLLWAGRFDIQKRLDILAGIAEGARARGLSVAIDFFGESVMGDPGLPATLERLEQAGAVRHPAYQHIADLDLGHYDAFVMTSEWEGVPNTLLEVMSSGLPVIAPVVGGVAEVLDESVGYPVARFDDVSAYLEAIESIRDAPDRARARGALARRRVHERFSVEAFDEALLSMGEYIGGRSEAYDLDVEFLGDERTSAFLASTAPRVYLFSGSGGYSNFGDILQPKNTIALWRRLAPDVEPVLLFHIGSVRSAERLAQLREWYGVDHIVFYTQGRDEVPEFVVPLGGGGVPGPVHVVGGGFLNSTWGVRFLTVIDRIGDVFGAAEFLMSGMQIDRYIVPYLQRFAAHRRLLALGLRDDISLAIAQEAGLPAVPTFDDLFESIEAWGADRPRAQRAPGPVRVGLHLNASDYVGGQKVIDAVRECLLAVLAQHPDAELTLLNAYPDRREEVLDTVAAIRLFGDEFPFATYRVVDIARAALTADIVTGEIPDDIRTLEFDFAITSSYHTTMLMNALDVPAYLIRLNDYYAQKAEIFELPRDFADFLAESRAFVPTFSRQRAERAAWIERLAVWMNGGALPALAEAEG